MNTDFPRILTLLRKERGISQKEAAGHLGISQALLSHYEKGIRECGLEFLVRASEFYQVSTDYLLGRTSDRSGFSSGFESEEGEGMAMEEELPGQKKTLIFHSLHILFDLLRRCANQKLFHEAALYIMLCIYQLFRILYSANPHNPPGLFSLPESLGEHYACALMQISEGRVRSMSKGERAEHLENLSDRDSLSLSPQSMVQDYPQYASSLLRLIQTVEGKLQMCSQE